MASAVEEAACAGDVATTSSLTRTSALSACAHVFSRLPEGARELSRDWSTSFSTSSSSDCAALRGRSSDPGTSALRRPRRRRASSMACWSSFSASLFHTACSLAFSMAPFTAEFQRRAMAIPLTARLSAAVARPLGLGLGLVCTSTSLILASCSAVITGRSWTRESLRMCSACSGASGAGAARLAPFVAESLALGVCSGGVATPWPRLVSSAAASTAM
mmetsp:Transcript_30105/g.80841  ORF Transcript_30105/g.80841 Transcript_30105/m.80841 type:complete len:218 (+) Transcript_30105:1970-2623(+)